MDGHTIGYASVKDEVARWKRTNSPREVYILQESREGQHAELYWGEVHLRIRAMWSGFYLAVFVLPISRYRFARLYPRSSPAGVFGHLLPGLEHRFRITVASVARYRSGSMALLRSFILDFIASATSSSFFPIALPTLSLEINVYRSAPRFHVMITIIIN